MQHARRIVRNREDACEIIQLHRQYDGNTGKLVRHGKLDKIFDPASIYSNDIKQSAVGGRFITKDCLFDKRELYYVDSNNFTMNIPRMVKFLRPMSYDHNVKWYISCYLNSIKELNLIYLSSIWFHQPVISIFLTDLKSYLAQDARKKTSKNTFLSYERRILGFVIDSFGGTKVHLVPVTRGVESNWKIEFLCLNDKELLILANSLYEYDNSIKASYKAKTEMECSVDKTCYFSDNDIGDTYSLGFKDSQLLYVQYSDNDDFLRIKHQSEWNSFSVMNSDCDTSLEFESLIPNGGVIDVNEYINHIPFDVEKYAIRYKIHKLINVEYPTRFRFNDMAVYQQKAMDICDKILNKINNGIIDKPLANIIHIKSKGI